MSNLSSYPIRSFSETQQFLVNDPATGTASRVRASDLVAYIAPRLNSVIAETTRLAAENTDYSVGEVIRTTGDLTVADGLGTTYLVVEGGTGDFPMFNGNDLLTIPAPTEDRVISRDSVAQMVASTGLVVGDTVQTSGYYSSGDGGGNDYEIVAGGTGTADGGSFIDLDNGLQAKGLFPGEVATPEQFGAIGDADSTTHGVATDNTSVITALVNFNLPILLINIYKVTDQILLEDSAVISGIGRTRCGIKIESDFNLAADGVISVKRIHTPGPDFRDFGIFFEQDLNETVRANIIQYPPAIDLFTKRAPRAFIKNFRIERAYNGIDLRGNNGGAHLDSIENGALNKGILTDGSFDFIFISNCQHWPFGITATPLYNNVYSDGETTYGEFLSVDSLILDNIATFRAKTVIDGGFGLISQANLDGPYATLEIKGGAKFSIGTLYSTSNVPEDFALKVSGVETKVTVATAWLENATDLTVSPGLIQLLTDATAELILGNVHVKTSGVNTRFIYQTEGTLTVNGGYLEPPANVNLASSFIDNVGGEIHLSSIRARDKGTGTGNLISLATDNRSSLNQITAPGWPISIPADSESIGLRSVECATNTSGTRRIRFDKTFEFSGTLDGAGEASFLHGLGLINNKFPTVNAFFFGGSGELNTLDIVFISGSTIKVSGGIAGRDYQVVVITR